MASAGLAAKPGQAGSEQYSQLPWTSSMLLSTAVAHQGESPSELVHRSKILPP